MKFLGYIFYYAFAAFAFTACCAAQIEDDDVDNLAVRELSRQAVLLTWTAVKPVACSYSITYSVFRDTKEEFTPSDANLIASGLTSSRYTSHEPKPLPAYYYHVRAVKIPERCTPPPPPPPAVLKTGQIFTYPLDLGVRYLITVGQKSEACLATSTSELYCESFPNFHAVIAAQGSHEYLLGCLSSEYQANNWTCVNLNSGPYSIGVHSNSVTVWGDLFSKINSETGKTISQITPEFSILGTLK
jgi:hypothetical protein